MLWAGRSLNHWGVMNLTAPRNPLLNSKSQSLVFGILTSLDIDPSLWLSPLLSLFLILKAELNSGPQSTA